MNFKDLGFVLSLPGNFCGIQGHKSPISEPFPAPYPYAPMSLLPKVAKKYSYTPPVKPGPC